MEIISYIRPLVRHSSLLSTLLSRSCVTPILSSHNINLVQKRGRHVRDDGAEPHRVLQYDMIEGKRTQADIVLRQFYRLHWGAWIRTRCGRDKTLHKKKNSIMREKREHVFCNAQQCRLLDRLTLSEVKRRHYYVDDEYEPYHSREEFKLTRKTPLPPSENIEKYLD